MIIPSIDIQNGEAVQLVNGRRLALTAGPPTDWAERFSLFGEIAVIDLDSALGTSSNLTSIKELCANYRCRVGGGIRTLEKAREILNAGARKIIIGTCATPEFLSQLPKDRLIAALDCYNNEVVSEGWQKNTGKRIEDLITLLEPYVSGFLVTFVETEGTLCGINIERAKELRALCRESSLTVAGGINSIEEISMLDRLGIDAQVGMSLYTGRFSYSDAIFGCVKKDKNDLVPTIIVDDIGEVLGLAYSSARSFSEAFKQRRGIYQSRSRSSIWNKGSTSGNTQDLLRVELDCDRDCLKFIVRQNGGGFCHLGSYNCFGERLPFAELLDTIADRKLSRDKDSYTLKLLNSPTLLNLKIQEEAFELTTSTSRANVIHESADLLYFLLVKMAQENVSFGEVLKELSKRRLTVTRRVSVKPQGDFFGGVV